MGGAFLSSKQSPITKALLLFTWSVLVLIGNIKTPENILSYLEPDTNIHEIIRKGGGDSYIFKFYITKLCHQNMLMVFLLYQNLDMVIYNMRGGGWGILLVYTANSHPHSQHS